MCLVHCFMTTNNEVLTAICVELTQLSMLIDHISSYMRHEYIQGICRLTGKRCGKLTLLQ